MKKVFKDAQEMAHAWANSNFDVYGFKGGNAKANYNRFYSYGTVIAQYVKDTCVLTKYRYSNTTNRHQSAVRGAFRYSNILFVESDVLNNYDLSSNYTTKEAFNHEFDVVKRLINKMIHLQAKAKKKDYTEEIYQLYSNLKKFAEFLGVDLDYQLPDIAEASEQVKQTLKKEKTEVKEFIKNNGETINNFANEAIKSWRNREIYTPSSYKPFREYLKGLSGKFKGVAEEVFNQLFKYDFIRIVDDKIETNRNARVSLEDARALLFCLESKKNCVGLKVGGYTVVSNNNQYIQIGCHKFDIAQNIDVLRQIA